MSLRLLLMMIILAAAAPADATATAQDPAGSGSPERPALPAARTRHTIEEVLAVVGRTPILMSDIDLAELVELAPRAAEETPARYRSHLLDLRINLELEYRDLEQSGVLYRLSTDVPAALEDLTRRAGGRERLEPRLETQGLAWADLEELALRVAAATAYVKERLLPQIAVSAEELNEAYQEEVVGRTPAASTPPPQSTMQAQLQTLLIERKINREIELWLEAARERLEVTRFAP